MRILLDTHILLWFLTDDERLSQTQIELIENKQNELFFSIGSLWEIAIKAGLLKLSVPSLSIAWCQRKCSWLISKFRI